MIAAHARHDAATVADFDADAPVAAIVYPESSPEADGSPPKGNGSRWNAVRHGCMARVLLPADLQAEADRYTAILTERYGPTNAFEVDTVAKMGRLSAQLERNQRMILVDQQRTMDRAVLRWSEDRNVYINKIAARLHEDAGVARALEGTKQGIEWLRKSWLCLEEVLAYAGGWTDEQNRLAVALIGPPMELRDTYCNMLAENDAAELADLLKNELAWLDGQLERSLNALDHAEQSMVAAGMPIEEDAEAKRLRKQESKLKLDLRRAKAELLDSRAEAAAAAAAAAPPPAPASEPEPEPEPVVSSMRSKPVQEPDPPKRPKTSNAAFNFLEKRSMRDAFEIPATATAPAKRVSVEFPFPGGDPEPDPESELETEAEVHDEAEVESTPPAEPVVERTQAAPVVTNASRVATASQRREQERRKHRAQEKKARKAARRNRR